MATVYLIRSEDWFWSTTPRILISLIDQWKIVEGVKSGQVTGETMEQEMIDNEVADNQDFMLL